MRNAEATEAEMEAAVTAAFLRHGIVAWSFVDEDGKPLPISNATIADRLDWATAHEVAEKCDELYGADLFRPLLARMATFSPPGPRAVSTSAPRDSGLTDPVPFKPSSRRASAGRRSGVRGR
jgi:hypothetical protein